MGAHTPELTPEVEASPRLATLALACLAPIDLPGDPLADAAPEARWLAELRLLHGAALNDLPAAFAAWRAAPPAADAALATLAGALRLTPIELLATALALAADTDVLAGRALAWLQAPHREPWPTVGLVACLAPWVEPSVASPLASLLDGCALSSGLLRLDAKGRALPDAVLAMPLPLVLAATGGRGAWPGVEEEEPTLPLAPGALQDAVDQARVLGRGLAVASGEPLEARAAAAAIARARAARPVFVTGEMPPGFGPWLVLRGALPIVCAAPGPGERRRLERPAGYTGPLLAATGLDGAWQADGLDLPVWTVPMPARAERAALWRDASVGADVADALARRHRHGAARIEALARVAHAMSHREGAGPLDGRHVAAAARRAGSRLLGALAEPLCDDIADEALVLPAALRRELDALRLRCEARDGLADGLGPAATARYRCGVRALFVGPSGTGKTLSAGWLATRLGVPLYRVDVAAVSSKYIGETEKNLAELFARAEHAGVALLFDEADALFGRRTDVKDANDRHANQQTNYLLQRIESFEGIVVLTSNGRGRFDTAFTRRLDAILEFPAPDAEERRALWLAHLGAAHTLEPAALNRLAAGCELAGGHIRNAVLGARASNGGAPIDAAALADALAAEYRKLGKGMPAGLAGP